MNRFLSAAAFASALVFSAAPAFAQDVTFSGTAEVKTAYVFSDGFRVDPDPVLQVSGSATVDNTTFGVWINEGKTFDEVDLTLRQDIGGGFSLEAARFIIPGDDITQAKIAWSADGWDAAVSHALWDNNPSGTALEVGRTWTRDRSSLRLGAYAETGFGFNPSLTPSATFARTLGGGLTARVKAQHTFLLNNKFGKDERGTEIIAGVSISF